MPLRCMVDWTCKSTYSYLCHYMEVSGQLRYPHGKLFECDLSRYLVGIIASLGAVEWRTVSYPCWDSKPDFLVMWLVS